MSVPVRLAEALSWMRVFGSPMQVLRLARAARAA